MLAAEDNRWMVVGICLSKVLTPVMRVVLEHEMQHLIAWRCDLHLKVTSSWRQTSEKFIYSIFSPFFISWFGVTHALKFPVCREMSLTCPCSHSHLALQLFCTHFIWCSSIYQSLDIKWGREGVTLFNQGSPFDRDPHFLGSTVTFLMMLNDISPVVWELELPILIFGVHY